MERGAWGWMKTFTARHCKRLWGIKTRLGKIADAKKRGRILAKCPDPPRKGG